HADPEGGGGGADPRLRDLPAAARGLAGGAAGGAGLALPRPLPAGGGGADPLGVGGLGQQPQGPLLPADRGGTAAPQEGARELGPAVRRRQPGPAHRLSARHELVSSREERRTGGAHGRGDALPPG